MRSVRVTAPWHGSRVVPLTRPARDDS